MSESRTSREIRWVLLLCMCAAFGPRTLSALDPDRSLSQYIVTRWGARESFPGGAINAIAQTPDGYLWIGAENGLVRFDGISFQLSITPTRRRSHPARCSAWKSILQACSGCACRVLS